jgi:hypothetical protein
LRLAKKALRLAKNALRLAKKALRLAKNIKLHYLLKGTSKN